MKKLISLVLLFAIALSCCACGGSGDATDVPETTEELKGGYKYDTEVTAPTMPDYSDVDQFTPNSKGVYQIYNAEGFLNIANDPDADYEILWDIDLGGAKWTPVGTKAKPFTGEIEGGGYTISNFVIDTPNEDGDMGIFGTFEGSVKELDTANVTITTTADTKRAGLWCAYNDGSFLRCDNTDSTMTVEAMADGAQIGAIVGVNDGQFRNGTMNVALNVTAAGKADIGGIAGYAKSGKIQFIKNQGAIEVTGGSNKNVGLFAGAVEKKAEIKGAVFLGEKSNIDGQMFTNYTGTGDREKVVDCLYRDNVKEEIPAAILAKRQQAADAMYEHGSYVWYLDQDLYYSCFCDLSGCYGMIPAGTEIHGNLYNHKGGSLARLKSMLNEDNYLQDWVYDIDSFDGWDVYIGCDCSTAVQHAYFTISATYDSNLIKHQIQGQGFGDVYAVGDWDWDLKPTPTYTSTYTQTTGEERMYESYALLRVGDTVNNRLNNGLSIGTHVRMVAKDAVVVRNEEGKIDGAESYVTTHEQGGGRTLEPYYSTWSLNKQYSFANLFQDTYVPCTIKEFITGEFEEPEAHLEGGVDGKPGLTTGTVYSNFFLDSVQMVITDESGAEVFNKRLFTTASRFYDDQRRDNDWEIKPNNHKMDLSHFAIPLQEVAFQRGQTYNCTIYAHLPVGDPVAVKTLSFTNGTAQ